MAQGHTVFQVYFAGLKLMLYVSVDVMHALCSTNPFHTVVLGGK